MSKQESDKSPEKKSSSQELIQKLSYSVSLADGNLLRQLASAVSLYLEEYKDSKDNLITCEKLNELVEKLGEARGLPLKIAQVLAFLDPKAPLELHEVLEVIQSHRRGMPYDQVAKIFMQEFGCEPDTLFSEFGRQPVAAASIAQVHRARMQDGTWVAVKVQYPEVRSRMESNFQDLEFAKVLAELLSGKTSDAKVLLADLQQTVLNECDFEREAQNQVRFYEAFKTDTEIIIPKVILSHSRKNILTSEWCNGKSWTEFKRTANHEERSQAGKIISRFYANSVFGLRLFHADPHPWNYLFTDGQVIFLDFGRVKPLTKEMCEQLHTFHQLILSSDREGMKAFLSANKLIKVHSDKDFDNLWQVLLDNSHHLRQSGAVMISKDLLQKYRENMRDLGKTGGIEIVPEFFWLVMFVHNLMLGGRADFAANVDWRQVLVQHMSVAENKKPTS